MRNMDQLTVAMTTYNLEKYIEEALLSVCRQKTTFPFSILIADDASTDHTVEIITKIQKQYPRIIKLLSSDQNRGSLANSNRVFAEINTKYFSFLDGDDYWTDDYFLQKRVDFLENNLEFTMCGSNTNYLKNGKIEGSVIQEQQCDKEYSFQDYLQENMPFIHTSSIVSRNIIFSNGLPDEYTEAVGKYYECALRGEDYRFLLHLHQGKVYVLSDYASCYRIHSQGVWQGASETKHQLEGLVAAFYYMGRWSNEYPVIFEKRFLSAYRRTMHFLYEHKIGQQYILNSKETYILASVLDDVSKADIHWEWEEELLPVITRIKNYLKRIIRK